jgi:hypothetical protein
LKEGILSFTFPADWSVTKYDDWPYYRKQFQKCCSGNKAVDFIAIANREVWLIEVKDFRSVKRREKELPLWDEIAIKVRDTLAGLVAAKFSDSHDQQTFANNALNASRIKVVLHLEQPSTHSKLFPRIFDRADVLQKLKQLIKPIDAHPLVIESSEMNGVSWTVNSLGANS